MVLTKWREPEQVEGALEGGARVCGDEAEVRICEATLSRTEEECHPIVRGVRAGESVLGAEKTVALGTGLARERRLLITGEPPKQAEDRKKPNPSACPGLAEHLLPRRHGLIQSFPSTRDRGCELLGLGDGERNRGRIDRDGNLRTCYRRLLRVAPATPYRENAKECRQSQQTRLQRLHTTPRSSWIDRM